MEFNLIADNNLILPEYKINLLNKNKKPIHKIEKIEQDANKHVFNNKKKFLSSNYNRKFNKQRKFRKKFNYYSKTKKNNFENKKSANY